MIISQDYKQVTPAYQERYEQIHTYIESGVSITNPSNIYTDEFKTFLHQIQIQYPAMYYDNILPSEPIIQVDLNNRFIDIEHSEYKEFLSMQKDHRAETVYFEMDRYFEDVDLASCSCIIEYINAGKQARVFPVTLKSIIKRQTEDPSIVAEKLLIAWNLGNEATTYKGTIQFAITFFSTVCERSETTGEIIACNIVYSLHTKPATGKILEGMVYTDKQITEYIHGYNLEENNYLAILNMLENQKQELTNMVEQKNLYWIDV